MIVLDTNVISEPLKPHGNVRVQTSLDRQLPETLFLTSTSLAGLLFGIECLPLGDRKTNILEAV
jgi:predicted nucleic acid-binding protein